MKEPLKLTIGSDKYIINMFGATEGMELSLEVGKVIGPGIGALVALKGAGSITNLKVTPDMITGLGTALTSGINPKEHAQMIVRLMSVVQIEGVGFAHEHFDNHFIGKYGHVMKLIVQVVLHNGFLDSIADLLPLKALPGKGGKSTSPTT